jgi:uncharacterized protein YndB with AHSA1/START domain
MKFVLWLLGALVGLVVLLLVIGFFLPSEFRVERSVLINAPAERVYPLVATPREWTRWSVWNERDPNMQIEYSGPESGAGAAWSWKSETEGNGEMEFTEATPPQRVVYVLRFPDMGMQSTGLMTVTPAEGGVQVTWTNEGDMGGNPLNRWFGMFMDSLVGPDFEAGLNKLKRVAEAG